MLPHNQGIQNYVKLCLTLLLHKFPTVSIQTKYAHLYTLGCRTGLVEYMS